MSRARLLVTPKSPKERRQQSMSATNLFENAENDSPNINTATKTQNISSCSPSCRSKSWATPTKRLFTTANTGGAVLVGSGASTGTGEEGGCGEGGDGGERTKSFRGNGRDHGTASTPTGASALLSTASNNRSKAGNDSICVLSTRNKVSTRMGSGRLSGQCHDEARGELLVNAAVKQHRTITPSSGGIVSNELLAKMCNPIVGSSNGSGCSLTETTDDVSEFPSKVLFGYASDNRGTSSASTTIVESDDSNCINNPFCLKAPFMIPRSKDEGLNNDTLTAKIESGSFFSFSANSPIRGKRAHNTVSRGVGSGLPLSPPPLQQNHLPLHALPRHPQPPYNQNLVQHQQLPPPPPQRQPPLTAYPIPYSRGWAPACPPGWTPGWTGVASGWSPAFVDIGGLRYPLPF